VVVVLDPDEEDPDEEDPDDELDPFDDDDVDEEDVDEESPDPDESLEVDSDFFLSGLVPLGTPEPFRLSVR